MVLPGDVEAVTSAGWWVCGEGRATEEEAVKDKVAQASKNVVRQTGIILFSHYLS